MSDPLSLGIVTGSMSRIAGGLFTSVRKSALHLAEAGASVSVYALEDEHSARDMPEWEPLVPQVLVTRRFGPLPFAPELADRLARADHEVLHLHGIWQPQSLTVNRWKRSTGRPVMISPRGMLDPWALSNSAWKKKIAGALFENRNLREADCLHALNDSEASAMRSYGLTNPIAVIPNATDLPEIAPRQVRAGRKTLLFLGRIHPKKGLAELVTAWGAAQARLRDEWQLAIAGWDDGGHLKALRTQIAQAGLDDSITILGPAFGEAKDGLLRKADALVLPSYSEGLPMSVLEAWAYRLPVLMTAECNLPEGFAAGAAAKIFTDPAAMARSLDANLLETDLAAMGEAGRALAEDRFSWPRIARENLHVYRWLVHGGERPACVRDTED